MALAPASGGSGRLPDFLVIGLARTATTWLDQVLRGHVGLPRDIKELDFFGKNYARGPEWYKSYFAGCDPGLPVGEICPTYFASAEVRKRIVELIPNCKIICTLRDPVDRVYSLYTLHQRNATTRKDFESYAAEGWGEDAQRLKAWLESFPRENVLICLYDELESDPQAYLDRICDFIGISRIAIAGSQIATERVNSFARAPKSRRLAKRARKLVEWLTAHELYRVTQFLSQSGVWRFCFERGDEFRRPEAEAEARLRARMLPEIEQIEKLIGRDLSAWKLPRVHRRGESGQIGSAAAAASGE